MALLQDATIWVLGSFIIFAIVAFRFGRAGLMGKLDGRIEEIKREIESASSLHLEAQELLAQYQRRQRDAAAEAQRIIETAKAHADEIRRQADADLDIALKRREAQLKDRLQRMEDNALAEIRAHAADLVVKATTEIIAARMDEQTNARLVDDSIGKVAGRLN